MSATDPTSILEEIRACLRKTKPSVPIDDDFDAISAENRLLKEEKRDLFTLLDSIETRLTEQRSPGRAAGGPSEEAGANNQPDGQKRGTSPTHNDSEGQANGGRATPVKQPATAKASNNLNRTRWSSLEAKVRDAWETFSGDGKDPVHVWSQSDVKLTDDKIMANLQRQYALHLVGFPLQSVSPTKNGEAGPKVTKTPDDRRANTTTSPGATNKRNVSPSATNRLPTPNVVAVALRRSTPVRVTATPSKASEKETPQKSVTPARTGLGPDRVTPVRRSSTPLAGAKSPSPAATTSKPMVATKIPTHADPSKPAIRFAVKGSAESESKTAAGPKANGTHPTKAAPATAPASGGAAKPLMGISAVLAQFKNIGPAETPRVPGDKRSPRPGLATATPANNTSSASLKREPKNEVKLGFAHSKPPAVAASTSASSSAAKSRVTPVKR